MANLNRVTLLGRLTKDPEIKPTAGQTVCKLDVVVSEVYFTKEKEKRERTLFQRVIVWGKQAENCGEYLVKGSTVYIEGRLGNNNYEKDGKMVYTTEVTATNVQFLDFKKDKPVTGKALASSSDPHNVEDDEVPF